MRTHYETLQVTRDASPEVIRAAYRQLVQKWHPDKHPNQADEAARMIREVNLAYEVLGDEERRRAYDATLGQGSDAAQEHPDEHDVYMANEVALNRAAWLNCVLWLVLILLLVGLAAGHTSRYRFALPIFVAAAFLFRLLRERFHIRTATRFLARPPIALKHAYDRMMSMRLLHLVGRGAVWTLLVLLIWHAAIQITASNAVSEVLNSTARAPSAESRSAAPIGSLSSPETAGAGVPVRPPQTAPGLTFLPYRVEGLEVPMPAGYRTSTDSGREADRLSRATYTYQLMMASPTAERAELRGWLSEGLRLTIRYPPQGQIWTDGLKPYEDEIMTGGMGFSAVLEDTEEMSAHFAGVPARIRGITGNSSQISQPEHAVLVSLRAPKCWVTVEVAMPASKKSLLETWVLRLNSGLRVACLTGS